jgi:hypothetical protein
MYLSEYELGSVTVLVAMVNNSVVLTFIRVKSWSTIPVIRFVKEKSARTL